MVPHTGYGYLHIGEPLADQVFNVRRFTEKPSFDTAQNYLAQGDWLWNSGMSCWRADLFLSLVQQFQPAMAESLSRLVDQPDLIESIYPNLFRISIDYAIMEPVSQQLSNGRILAVPLQADWADIGHFTALAQHMPQVLGNAVTGNVVIHNSDSNLILNQDPDRLIAVSGLADMIVVQDHNVTLICPKDQAETIKQLVTQVQLEAEEYA